MTSAAVCVSLPSVLLTVLKDTGRIHARIA